ncbi:MAG: substrate-binding domain-containing protein [Lachnospiraceae bacterium]
MKKETNKKRWNGSEKVVIGILLLIVATTLLLVVALWYMKQDSVKVSNSHSRTYKYHYMLIENEPDSAFFRSLYRGAQKAGGKRNIYVEDLAESLDKSYNVAELMEIAIAANIDGIIVEANDTKQLQELIDRASEQNIPVVTTYEDAPKSKRKSFVGINGQQLGEIYGEKIVECKQENVPLRATVLIDSEGNSENSRLVYSGMKKVVSQEEIELDVIRVDRKDPFSIEEKIRSLVLSGEQRPDVLICMDEVETICAYQAVVDYNAVGKMQIIGNYTSPEILQAIEKGVISSSIVIDAEKMGAKAVETLCNYQKSKFINEYETITPQVITKENVEAAIKEADKNE